MGGGGTAAELRRNWTVTGICSCGRYTLGNAGRCPDCADALADKLMQWSRRPARQAAWLNFLATSETYSLQESEEVAGDSVAPPS